MEDAITASGGTVHWIEAPGDVLIRAANWPEGPRGVVLLLNGRTEFIEKYLETVADLQARGFAVWTFDWRGQGASTRPLPDPLVHHVKHFDEYLGDLLFIADRFILPGQGQRPLVLMAHSMGGHIGAHFLARRPEIFARAILLAPMIDFLRGGRIPRWVIHLLARGVCAVPGAMRRFSPGAPRAVDLDYPFEGNKLTTSPERFAADLGLVRDTPALGLGGVSWGWLRAALNSIVSLQDPRIIARINMHVLVAMAGDEAIVDNRAIRRFAVKLPRGKWIKIAGARHELLRETDAHRAALWSTIDQFLEPLA